LSLVFLDHHRLPPEIAAQLGEHLERINNSINGNGFRTAAEIAGGVLAIVNVYWTATVNGFEWAFQKPEIIWQGGEINQDYYDRTHHMGGYSPDGITMLDPIDHMALEGILEGLIKGLLGAAVKGAVTETGTETVKFFRTQNSLHSLYF